MRFVKRPVEISAVQWDGTVEGATAIIDWVLASGGTARYHEAGERVAGPGRGMTTLPQYIAIETLEGTMRASAGDWIIRGVSNEFYPCKPEVFTKTYEPVEDSEEEG